MTLHPDEVQRVLKLIQGEPSYALIYLPKIYPPANRRPGRKFFGSDQDYMAESRRLRPASLTPSKRRAGTILRIP